MQENRDKIKKNYPLNRSIIVAGIIFIVLLSSVMALVMYRIYKDSMYARYREEMVSIVNYTETFIDHDDMSQCAETFIPSEKHIETQAFFDHFVDYYTNLHYLYIIKPLEPGDPIYIKSVLSANSSYEKEYEPENVINIGAGEVGWYDEETWHYFRKIMEGNEDVYFDETTEWGTDYTLARPLVNSKGEHYAVLCVDVSVSELQHLINRNTLIMILVIVGLGTIFIGMLLFWMNRFVVRPIHQLESSVTAFADSSHGKRNPDELVFEAPMISSSREIESLNEAVSKMSINMKDYVKNILAAEEKVEGLQAHVTEINAIAYQDALTHVNNKAAYDKKAEYLNEKIPGQDVEFAIVMADLNNLKMINDKYGHDKGNEYLIGSCKLICDVFTHSPVYRIGGDEFAVVLQDRDYRNRKALFEIIKREFQVTSQRKKVDPWKRYSAAVGMSAYIHGEDENVDSVFKRADNEMYAMKMEMHKNGM